MFRDLAEEIRSTIRKVPGGTTGSRASKQKVARNAARRKAGDPSMRGQGYYGMTLSRADTDAQRKRTGGK